MLQHAYGRLLSSQQMLKPYKLFGIFMDAEGRLAEHPRDASLLLTLASGCML